MRADDDARAMLAGLDPAGTPAVLPDAQRREQDLQRIMTSTPQPGRAGVRPYRSRVRRRAILAGGLALGVIVTATVVPNLGSRPDVTGPESTAGPEADVARSAPALLLAAAAHTETTAPSTVGRYWLAERQRGTLQQIGPADNRYVLQIRHRHDSWLSTVRGDPEGMVTQHLGAAPATAVDEAAWKRHGSPATWFHGAPENPGPAGPFEVPGLYSGVTAAPGQLSSYVQPDANAGWSFVTGGKFLTAEQLLALPAEPAALRKALLACRPSSSDADDTSWLFGAGRQVLMGLPVPPKVRGAAYRILSGLPGVRALGPMDDPAGRRGEAIAITNRSPATRFTGPVEDILIFDPATGTTLSTAERLLQPAAAAAWAKPGTIWTYELLVSAGWTTRTPPPQSFPPDVLLKADGSVATPAEVAAAWERSRNESQPPAAPQHPGVTASPSAR